MWIALQLVIVVTYLLAAAWAWRSPGRQEMARNITMVGALLHASSLVHDLMQPELLPGFAESLSAAGLGVVVAWLLVSRGAMNGMGKWVSIAAAGLVVGSMAVPTATVATLEEVGASVWLPLHLGLMFASVSAFFLEFFATMVQYVVRQRLKAKKFSGLGSLPSLERLGAVQVRALVFGLVFLTFGVAAGGVWASTAMHHKSWLADPKVILTTVVWGWYALALVSRLVSGWQGRTSMVFSVLGFSGLLFSMIGVDFLVEGFHAYR